ncbi:MAG: glycosyltransferase family 1 protein [Candidatus Gracilibacteria bacterium]|jgi:glycosyltransferase involved in cell wall biosynthesis
MKKVVIVTDAWSKNINGVVTAIKYTKQGLEEKGYEVTIIHPGLFRNIPMPYYAEVRVPIFAGRKLGKMLKKIQPDYVHIETEGALGLTARMACRRRKWKFTTSYHTRMPEYVAIRIKLKKIKKMTWDYLRWFHSKSQKILASTLCLKKELEKMRFKNIAIVPFGVDLDLFKKNPKAEIPVGFKKPIFTFLGRIDPEKNLRAFLEADLPGTKLIIGDGQEKKKLEKEFTGENIIFVGRKKGRKIVDLLSISDVFVFPSKTDTFGLVLVEALACEVPVAAYDVHGPKDVIKNGFDGFLGENLAENTMKCLKLNPKNCRKTALKYSWDNFTKKFIKNLVHV